MTGQAEIEKTYGVATADASPPGDWRAAVCDAPSKEPAAYARYWQRLAECAELQAHEHEERALLAEQRAEQAQQRADELERSAVQAQQRAEQQQVRAEAAERRAVGLEAGLTSRTAIDEAKGVIMGVFGLSSEPAFEVLVWVSQQSNTKVKVVAERFLAQVHDLDLGHPPRDRLTRTLATLAGLNGTASI